MLQYFPTTDIPSIVMGVIYLLHLFINFPFMALISRQCMASLVYGDMTKETKKFRHVFLVIYLSICLLVQISNYNFDYILQIDGCIIGYFSMFIFPVMLQIRRRLVEYGIIKDNSNKHKILFLDEKQIKECNRAAPAASDRLPLPCRCHLPRATLCLSFVFFSSSSVFM